MMTHEEWIDRLLVADPAELAGEGAGPVAVHVRECARCRTLGRRLLEEQERLAAALEALGPPAPRAVPVRTGATARPSRADWPGRAVWWVPLATAAGLAALLLAWPDRGNVPVPPGETPRPATVAVEVPVGVQAMVVETRDPEVTLVWLDEPKGEAR